MPELIRPRVEVPQEPQHGFVTTAPASSADELQVVIPDFSTDHVFEIRRWMSRGAALPALGDEVLVVRDEQGEPWVPAWWSAENPGTVGAMKGAVVHEDNPNVARPGGFVSVEWIGTVEPLNAIDNDTWVNPGS